MNDFLPSPMRLSQTSSRLLVLEREHQNFTQLLILKRLELIGRTRMIENEPANPRWYESFHIYYAHLASDISYLMSYWKSICTPLQEVLGGEEVDRWVDICDRERIPLSTGARMHVKMYYFDVGQERNWARGSKVLSFLEFLTPFSHREHDLRCLSIRM